MVEDPKFNNTILTNIGHQMLASIASGNRKITYTKAEAYTQDVSSISNETLQALTSLQGKELSANLLVSNDNGNVVTITANFENKSLTNDVVFNSIGWFAKLDTDDAEHGITANQEYLMGITPANGAQTLVAPPADQSASQAISLNLNMTLSDAANVNMTVSDAGTVHFNQLDDQLAKYTTTSDLTKLLAGKADLGLSYTKAELDAKLLNLTTDTNGKVSADQVQALISDKANISDVYSKSQIDSALSTRDAQINTKANASDVYTKSQVDSALSTRDTQISTKANISDVYTKSDVDNAFTDVRGRLGKLEGTQTLDSPDFNSITSTGVYYITNNTPANIKNNPVSQWGVLVVSNGDGHRISQVYYPDDGSPQWCRLLNESNWLPWYQLSTKKDISNAINKFDLSKVKFHKQYINSDGQAADKTWSATKNEDGTYTIDLWNDDRTASKLHDVLTQLPNKADTTTVNSQVEDAKNTAQSKLDQAKSDLTSLIDSIKNFNVDSYKGGIPSTDMNKITDAGLYGFSNAILTNSPYTGNRWGLLLVIREFDNDPNNIDQFIASNGSLFWRNISLTNNVYPNWKRFADDGDVDGLKDQINTKANASDLSALDSRAVKSIGIYPNDLNFTNGQFTNWSNEMKASPDANGYALIDLTDDESARAAVNQLNAMLASINAVNNKVNVEGSLFRMLSAGNTWNDILGFDNGDAPALVAFRGNSGGPMNNLLGNYSAGVAFGGGDTKGFLEVSYADHNARIGGGNGTAPTWHEDIAWKSDVNDLRNQIQQLRDNQFEVQTFTDATAAANWEAQKPGKRMAIVNS